MNKILYWDSKSILVINPSGKLKQLFTPFRVTAVNARGNNRELLIVEEVQSTREGNLFYLIGGNPYPHSLFEIKISF